MKSRTKRFIGYGVLVAFGIASFVLIYFQNSSREMGVPNMVLGASFVLAVLFIFFMAMGLRFSMKKTLYSYRNIGLIAGILYAANIAVMLLDYYLSFRFEDGPSWTELYYRYLEIPENFLFYALFLIFVVCVLLGISNAVLIWREGFHLHNLFGVLLGVFYVGGTLLVYSVNTLLNKEIFLDNGLSRTPFYFLFNVSFPLFLMLMLCYLECILAGTAIMGWKAARHIPAYDKDFIIILGCSIDRRGGLRPLLKGRVNRAIRFAWEQELETGRPCKYVPSGGQGPGEVMSEASAMELYLLTKGAEYYEVFPEKQSVNTEQNFRFSKKIIDVQKPDAKVAFATTNYHILRSGILARRAGIDAEGIAGDTKWYFWSNGFVREFFAILSMNIRTHFVVAVVAAGISVFAGLVGWFANI